MKRIHNYCWLFLALILLSGCGLSADSETEQYVEGFFRDISNLNGPDLRFDFVTITSQYVCNIEAEYSGGMGAGLFVNSLETAVDEIRGKNISVSCSDIENSSPTSSRDILECQVSGEHTGNYRIVLSQGKVCGFSEVYE